MQLYTELQVCSYYSFLRGASSPEELVLKAKELGHQAIALTDYNSLSGVVRAHKIAKKIGIQFIPATCFQVKDCPTILCYPINRIAYGKITKLLSIGKRRTNKGECEIFLNDIIQELNLQNSNDQVMIIPIENIITQSFQSFVHTLTKLIKKNLYLSVSYEYSSFDQGKLEFGKQISKETRVPLIATNNVHDHQHSRRPIQDILTCIRENVTLNEAGYRLFANGERYLKPPQEMFRLFSNQPDMITRTIEVAQKCQFSLDELHYQYPIPNIKKETIPQNELKRLTWLGAHKRFPDLIPDKIRKQIKHELLIIKKLGFAPYFLVVFDLVNFANKNGILCHGRGSAANSTICFCLGITAVNPISNNLLFERFISPDRREPPDIDIDFESGRREEVIQYIYKKYGRNHAGIASSTITFRKRAALRAIGKAFQLKNNTITALQNLARYRNWNDISSKDIEENGLNSKCDIIRHCFVLARELSGFPRYLSQHTGGMVMTLSRLDEIVPISNARMKGRTVIEWDKNDLDTLGILKIDILALGMLTCIQQCFKLIFYHHNKKLTLTDIPLEDEKVYDMLCKADTVGVFQVESRAQMSMLPRLRPKNFYDLVIEIAIVRPGPIQGNMVHPYLRRRDGLEEIHYPSEEIQQVLEKTLGIPIFQEQVMKIAIVAAGFDPAEADELRKVLAQFSNLERIDLFRKKFISGMIAKKYTLEFSQHCFKQIEGFAGYGFPESHAASFALLVYISAWIKFYYPAVFTCSLLNSQPMGFYAPAQLIRDAREHEVQVFPVDVNLSNWECILEKTKQKTWGIRLGFKQIIGFRYTDSVDIVSFREKQYKDIEDLQFKTKLSKSSLLQLAKANAFNSMKINSRQGVWIVKGLNTIPIPLFSAINDKSLSLNEELCALPKTSLLEQVSNDYKNYNFSLNSHPLFLLRGQLKAEGYSFNKVIKVMKSNQIVRLAGIVTCRQQPASANGVTFLTIEDETSIVNIVIWPNIFKKYQREIINANIIGVEGYIQREKQVLHVVGRSFFDLTKHWDHLST